jgi:PKD repeat protein
MKKLLLVVSVLLLVFFAATSGHPQSTWSFVTIPDLPSGAYPWRLWTDQPGNLYVWATRVTPNTTNVDEAFLYHWDGTSWSQDLHLPAHNVGVWRGHVFGTSASDVFASAYDITNQKVVIYHYDGISWTEQTLPAEVGVCENLRGIVGEPGNVYAFAQKCPSPLSHVLGYDGSSWQVVHSSDCGVVPAYISQDEIYATTCWGHSLWNGSSWTWYGGFDFCDVWDIWGMRDVGGTLHLYTSGANNFNNGVRVWQFKENYPGSMTGSWGSKYGTVFSDPPGSGYSGAGNTYGIWGSGPDDIYVVGWRHDGDPYAANNGRVYHFNGTAWERIMAFGDIHTALDVYGTGPDDVWVSLSDGRLLHYGPVNQPPTADPNGPYSGDEGSPVSFDGTGSTDPDGDPLEYEWDFGDSNTGTGPTPSHSYADNGIYNVCLTVTDSTGASDEECTTATISNAAPIVGPIAAPLDPVQVNTTISTSADFTDTGTEDTHTAVWDWGDGNQCDTTSIDPNCALSQSPGSGSVSGNHSYMEAGVYTVTLTVTDDDGDSGESVFQFVVVYDPEGGFVTGGGWIDSPEGAYAADPLLTGKATFGFVSKYKKGADVPSGQTQFQFKVADLNFHSDTYQWLVVAGPQTKFKGTGTINGTGNYGFMLSAVDEKLTPNTDVDMFRIKIWDIDDGDDLVYDNEIGIGEDIEASTEIGGGSIVIHNK